MVRARRCARGAVTKRRLMAGIGALVLLAAGFGAGWFEHRPGKVPSVGLSVRVPRVIGLTDATAAEGALRNAHLYARVCRITDEARAQVLNQFPRAGSLVSIGTSVDVLVPNGIGLTDPPNCWKWFPGEIGG
jgi:beta-lactam-binding protein with PASTA domain